MIPLALCLLGWAAAPGGQAQETSGANAAASVIPAAPDAQARTASGPSRAESRTAELFRQANTRMAEEGAVAASGGQNRPAPLLDALQSGDVGTRQRGMASWYANSLHGERTANGERYDRNEMTAAHPTLPMGTWVKVTRLGVQRSVLVRVNDRGPFAKNRILDLSYQAARELGMINTGTARVMMEVVPAPDDGATVRQTASAN